MKSFNIAIGCCVPYWSITGIEMLSMKKTRRLRPYGPSVSLVRRSKFDSIAFWTSKLAVLELKFKDNELNCSAFIFSRNVLTTVVLAVPDSPMNRTFLLALTKVSKIHVLRTVSRFCTKMLAKRRSGGAT